ncbi:DUF4352 domain-containing protein [Actinomadura viridis]|uniref:DUF4352 domain-containing protein n=1 Tax=Actinomadura viridis TaxID=58110 RepID=UPI0036C10E01
MRPSTTAVLSACSAIFLLTAASACSGGDRDRSRQSPAYDLPARTVRDGEKAVRAGTVRSGDTAFTVIGYRGGMPELVGSHADMAPKGAYVRVRLVVENAGRTNQTFSAERQLLVTATGRTAEPDREAMLIKRQPAEFEVGAAVRVEMDLWYDVPRGERPVALRLSGSASVGAVSDPPPAEVKLP